MLKESLSSSSDGEGRVKHFPEYTAPGNLIRLNEMKPVTKDADVKMTYSGKQYMTSGSPVALSFEYDC